MKKQILTLVLLLILGFGFNSVAQNKPLKTLAFVIGQWEMKTSKGKIIELWTKNSDNRLSGKSYRINAKGDSLLTETLVIKNIGKDIFYCSTVTGQNAGGEVCFKLISQDNNTYVFENKEHDFPQRIIYQNQGKNDLLAWIEGEFNGKTKKSTFKYNRMDLHK